MPLESGAPATWACPPMGKGLGRQKRPAPNLSGNPVRADDRGGGAGTPALQAPAALVGRFLPVSEHHETRSELTFADRHIGPDAAAVDTLLSTIGVSSLDELAAALARAAAGKGDAEVVGYDVRPESLARLAPTGVQVAESMSDIIFSVQYHSPFPACGRTCARGLSLG